MQVETTSHLEHHFGRVHCSPCQKGLNHLILTIPLVGEYTLGHEAELERSLMQCLCSQLCLRGQGALGHSLPLNAEGPLQE